MGALHRESEYSSMYIAVWNSAQVLHLTIWARHPGAEDFAKRLVLPGQRQATAKHDRMVTGFNSTLAVPAAYVASSLASSATSQA